MNIGGKEPTFVYLALTSTNLHVEPGSKLRFRTTLPKIMQKLLPCFAVFAFSVLFIMSGIEITALVILVL